MSTNHDQRITRLKKAEIIPTVIDNFLPLLSLSVSWAKKEAALGNTLKVKQVQDSLSLTLKLGTCIFVLENEIKASINVKGNMTYVIALQSPTPALEKTQSGASSASGSLLACDTNNMEHIVKYKPPGPPPKTGNTATFSGSLCPVKELDWTGLGSPSNPTRSSERPMELQGLQE